MYLEINIGLIEQDHNGITVTGDASLWADDIRIYLVKNAAIRIRQG